MKRLLAVALCLLSFAMPVMPIAVAHAEDGTAPSSSSSSSSTSTDTKKTTTTQTSAEQLAKRVEENKKKFVAALTEAVKKRLTERCAASQTKVKAFATINDKVVDARTTSYTNILDKLNDVLVRALEQDLDVADLKVSVADLQAKVTALKDKITAYRQALSDVDGMQCASDPAGFKASLEAARAAQTEVIKAVKEIRTLITGTIRPQLDSLKKTLNASKPSDSTSTEGNQ